MNHYRHRKSDSFTLVELLVTIVLCASFFTTAAIVHQSVTENRVRSQAFERIALPTSVFTSIPSGAEPGDLLSNFYNLDVDPPELTVHTAPSYGSQAPTANTMRERFWEDVERSAGVFPLARNTLNTVRPTSIPLPTEHNGQTVQTVDNFSLLLNAAYPAAFEIYLPARNYSNATSASVYVLQPSSTENSIDVRSIWEIDLLNAWPVGVDSSVEPKVYSTFASVRRYVGTTRTDYFHVYYPGDSSTINGGLRGLPNTAFGPLFVIFERKAGLNIVEPDADKFKKASEHPFFFMWWPDPALPFKAINIDSTTYNISTAAATDPRIAYFNMGIRTSYFFVVPMFPAF